MEFEYKYRRQGSGRLYDLKEQVWNQDDLDELAEAAAQDYWNNHDGWGARWPIVFEIFDAHGEEMLGTREVAMEAEPVFTASGT